MLGLLAACVDLSTFGDSERDTRPAEARVRWSGYVLRSGDEDASPLDDGTVTFVVAGSGETFLATQPSPEDLPGYWSVALPPDVAVTVRIEGPGLRRAVWPLHTPGESANWSTGTLFGAEVDWIDARFQRAAREAGLPEPTWRDDRVRLWGFWRDGATGDCAATSLDDMPVVCLATDEAGGMEAVEAGPFSSWYAWDVAPGARMFAAGGTDGGVTRVGLDAEGGDIVTLGWLVPAP